MEKKTRLFVIISLLVFVFTACCSTCPKCPKIKITCEFVDDMVRHNSCTSLDPNKAVQIIGENIYFNGKYIDKAKKVAICAEHNGWCVSKAPTTQDFLIINKKGFYVISKTTFAKKIKLLNHPIFSATTGIQTINGRRFNLAVWDGNKIKYWMKVHNLFGKPTGEFVYQNNLPDDNTNKCLLIPRDIIP